MDPAQSNDSKADVCLAVSEPIPTRGRCVILLNRRFPDHGPRGLAAWITSKHEICREFWTWVYNYCRMRGSPSSIALLYLLPM